MSTDTSTAAKSVSAPGKRLDRDEWLALALDALAAEGSAVLTIGGLAERLGVSRGSFYWHFTDRTDFVRQLAQYWADVYTTLVPERIGRVGGSAEDRLLALMELLAREDLGRYDIPIRAWANNEPEAARIVRQVDRIRLDLLRSLFAEMGFEGEELNMRTRMFVTYQSFEHGISPMPSRKQRLENIKLRHRLFTRR